mgnify:FL=1
MSVPLQKQTVKMKAIKTENKNGTFTFTTENGDVIVKSTKRNYNAFALCYATDYCGDVCLHVLASTTKGEQQAIEMGSKNISDGYELFTATI